MGINSMTKTIRHSLGFTLLEFVIVVSVFGVISVLMYESILTLLKRNREIVVTKNISQSGDLAISTIERELQSATHIMSTCDGTLLQNVDFIASTGDKTKFSCTDINNATPRLTKTVTNQVTNTDTVTYVTPDTIVLTGTSCANDTLAIHCSGVSGEPPRISIEFSLKDKRIEYDGITSQNFRSTVTLRN
jgi:prepilin-type N-terminal cleavage/methylation domain-containing protein